MGIISGIGKLMYFSACVAAGAVITYNTLMNEETQDDTRLEAVIRDNVDILSEGHAWLTERMTEPMLELRAEQCISEDYALGQCEQLISEYLQCPEGE